MTTALALVQAIAGCRCSSEPARTTAVASRPGDASDCRRGSALLTLGPGATEGESVRAPLDPNAELPFATEPGMAIAFAGGFFATGQRHESRGAIALLGRLGADDAPTQLIELARVRGDVLPPRLASDGADLWVALQDGTPAGRALRVARFAGGDLSQAPAWRPGPEQANAESSGFDIAAQPGLALLVYDDWSPTANHGRILAAPVRAAAVAPARLEGRVVSPPDVDAESPRIVARPGGFWLAWLVNGSGGGAGRVYDPGDGVTRRSAAASAYGARWLSIMALDRDGEPVSGARRLTARQERVVGYDLTTGPTGAAWVAWRQDAPTPGSSGGRILVAEVPIDASAEKRPLRADDVGAGEPTWLFAGNDARRWLTFPDARDRTVLLRAASFVDFGAPLRLDPDLEGAGALAASEDRVLFAVPRGRALELFPATCLARPFGASPDAGRGEGAEASSLPPSVDAGLQRPGRAAP